MNRYNGDNELSVVKKNDSSSRPKIKETTHVRTDENLNYKNKHLVQVHQKHGEFCIQQQRIHNKNSMKISRYCSKINSISWTEKVCMHKDCCSYVYFENCTPALTFPAIFFQLPLPWKTLEWLEMHMEGTSDFVQWGNIKEFLNNHKKLQLLFNAVSFRAFKDNTCKVYCTKHVVCLSCLKCNFIVTFCKNVIKSYCDACGNEFISPYFN